VWTTRITETESTNYQSLTAFSYNNYWDCEQQLLRLIWFLQELMRLVFRAISTLLKLTSCFSGYTL
jgi:hypothetical protein